MLKTEFQDVLVCFLFRISFDKFGNVIGIWKCWLLLPFSFALENSYEQSLISQSHPWEGWNMSLNLTIDQNRPFSKLLFLKHWIEFAHFGSTLVCKIKSPNWFHSHSVKGLNGTLIVTHAQVLHLILPFWIVHHFNLTYGLYCNSKTEIENKKIVGYSKKSEINIC